MRKILYVFTGGRRRRLEQILSGEEVPQEFLFGVPWLLENGHKVDIVELSDLNPDKSSFCYKLRQKKNDIFAKLTGLSSCSHFFDKHVIDEFNNYDLIIAGNEYIAFGLHRYIKNGLLKSPVIFFVMGMLAKLYKIRGSWIRFTSGKYRYRELLRTSSKCVFLGKGEYECAASLFPAFQKNFEFLPYAVDSKFWKPEKNSQDDEYVLFIGNDLNRDYELVLKIAEQMNSFRFKLITKRISPDRVPQNAELISGDWKKSVLSDRDVRDIIRKCSVVILPLKETLQPSGQSVCQQAMSCGKAVVISKTRGFWCPGNFVDRKHLSFVETNDAVDWSRHISKLINDPGKLQYIGMNARKLMDDKYNLEIFGKKLERIISDKMQVIK